MAKFTELKVDTRPKFIVTKRLVFSLPRSVRFKCVRCGWCCRTNKAPLTHSDIKRFKKLGHRDFVVPDIRGTSLIGKVLRHKNGRCIFQDTKNRCTVYKDRPLICRCYPYTIVGITEPSRRIVVSYRIEHDPVQGGLCNGFYYGEPQLDDVRQYIKPLIDEWHWNLKHARIDAQKHRV